MDDRMYESAAAFGQALDRLVAEIEEDADRVIRKTLVDVTEKIKKDTPRDTGRAAAGWMLTADHPSEYIPPEGRYSLTSTDDPGGAKSKMWYITNNVEYISRLEKGYSKQAPTGMVANALNSFARLLKNNTKDEDTLE